MPSSKSINESKLLKLLATLSDLELKRFEKLVNSPIYNQNKLVCRLFLYLKKQAPDFPKDILEETVVNFLVPNESKDKGKKRLKDTMSRLTKLVEQFFIFEKQNSQPLRQNYLLIDAFGERKLETYIPTLLRRNKSLLEHAEYQSSNFYFDQFLHGESKFHYKIRMNNRSKSANVQEVIDLFLNYSVGHLLRYYCAALNREKYLNVRYQYPLLQAILAQIEQENIHSNPLICCYYYILKLLHEDAESKHFTALKRLLAEKGTEFPPHELRQMYAFALNICNNQVKEGKREYAQELFLLYQETLKLGVLNHGKHLAAFYFLHIVKSALRLGKLEWASEFMSNYKEEMPPESRANSYAFSMAYWHFYRKEYELATDHLLQIGPPEDFYYNFYYRVLMICIYYDKEQELSLRSRDYLHANIEALRQYIRRRSKDEDKPMSAFVLAAYDNFQKLVKRLLELRVDLAYKRNPILLVARLEKDIQETVPLEEREWLLAKVQKIAGLEITNEF